MDPNWLLILIAMGAATGVFLGFMLSGNGYGWLLNALAGGTGAIFGSHMLAHTAADMGPTINAMMIATALSTLTALLLRT